jgi:hypothetical protein
MHRRHVDMCWNPNPGSQNVVSHTFGRWLWPTSVPANDAANTGTLFVNKVSDEFEAASMDGVVDRRPVVGIYLLGIVFAKTYLIVEEVWSQYYLTVQCLEKSFLMKFLCKYI